jgi:hypothetical protein
MDEVEKGSRVELAKWYRFLPRGDTKEQQRVLDRIAERFKEVGGMTPELSKKIAPSPLNADYAGTCGSASTLGNVLQRLMTMARIPPSPP